MKGTSQGNTIGIEELLTVGKKGLVEEVAFN